MVNCPNIYYCIYNKKNAYNFKDKTLFVEVNENKDYNESNSNQIKEKCLICLEYYDINFQYNPTYRLWMHCSSTLL